MSKPQLDIRIGADGKLRVKVSGVSGEECTRLADMVRDIVGTEDSRIQTPEHYGDVRHVASNSANQSVQNKSRFSGL